jgi:hypothetical protein
VPSYGVRRLPRRLIIRPDRLRPPSWQRTDRPGAGYPDGCGKPIKHLLGLSSRSAVSSETAFRATFPAEMTKTSGSIAMRGTQSREGQAFVT